MTVQFFGRVPQKAGGFTERLSRGVCVPVGAAIAISGIAAAAAAAAAAAGGGSPLKDGCNSPNATPVAGRFGRAMAKRSYLLITLILGRAPPWPPLAPWSLR